MKPRIIFLALAASPLLVAACRNPSPDSGPLSVQSPAAAPLSARAGPGDVSVVTWNVYYGADLDVLLQPSPLPLPAQVAVLFSQVQATRADERAALMAKRLAEAPPDLIGLQEVARYRTQSPGDFLDAAGNIQNPFPNAPTDVFDFAALLVGALAAEGVDYLVASRTSTFDVELPIVGAGPCPPCDDLRLTESVAILARADVAISSPGGSTFAINLPVNVAGFNLEIVKGWASIDATIKEKTYRFLTTHLEAADIGPGHAVVPEVEQIQLAQAVEVLGVVGASPWPVILTGDLNSEPDGGSTATYEALSDAGFVDAWRVGPPRGAGFTANQDADLLNPVSALWHRIDFVLYRDEFTVDQRTFRGAVHADRLGASPADRTPSGLWPSDHAGVRAVLKPPPGRP